MANAFPASVNTFANPGSGTYTDDPGFELDVVISEMRDAIEADETKVGATPPAAQLLGYFLNGDSVSRSQWTHVTAIQGFYPLINGTMNVWQENTTFAAAASGTWTADNWIYAKAGAVVHSVLRSTDTPAVAASGHRVNYSLQLDVTTADAVIAAGDFATISTRIEGFLWARFDQLAFALRFWVKAAKAGRHYVYARNSGSDRSCVVGYDVQVANTWEQKQVAFPGNPATGTWDWTTGRGLEIGWTLAAGTTFHTTAGAWQTGDFKAASDQVNELDNVANNFHIALVGQPTLGAHGMPQTPIPYPIDRWLCQRYYEKSYEDVTAPGSVATVGEVIGQASNAVAASTAGTLYLPVAPTFMATKRVVPTVVLYGISPATANAILVAAGTRTGVTPSGTSVNLVWDQFTIDNSSAVAITDRSMVQLQWTAASRIP